MHILFKILTIFKIPTMRILLVIPFFLLYFCLDTRAQQSTVFLSEGKIEFEKKVNIYAIMEKMEDNEAWSDLWKKSASKFMTTYFDLQFAGNKTLYKPGREVEDGTNRGFFQNAPGSDNIIYSDLENARSTSQKKVFEQVFLVTDSTRKIQWKLTDETRTIAGFACRRANAIIMDSIYVVAFYTEEILTPGGPESFTGLPGMILGVSLPHQHVTWFATKVQVTGSNPATILPPVKGKKTDTHALKETLTAQLPDWNKSMRQIFLEDVML